MSKLEGIDVITAAGGDGKFLQRAVSSVASQELPVTQYVVGPRTDEIERVCNARGHVEFLERDALSVSEARNAGIDAGDAPIIAFLDADDRFNPEHLTEVRETLSGADVVWTDMMVENGGTFIKELPEPTSIEEFYRKFRAVPLSALALRRSALDRVRFRPALELGEGIDFVARVIRNSEPAKLDESTVTKLAREESLCTSMGLFDRVTYQVAAAVGLARDIPSCRRLLPLVVSKILWRAVRDCTINR
jgi:hypothetical protein